uniref:Uncharacterized protein n=1 Tax=Rhizophora mucronata TaxID=61149 RepID=A0A2P2NC63_RHIMU
MFIIEWMARNDSCSRPQFNLGLRLCCCRFHCIC